jgi:hypothetical protein
MSEQIEAFPGSDLGRKFDKGKPLAGLLIQDFPRALKAVAEIATGGAEKYDRSNWLQVKDGETRYTDAMVRHLIDSQITPLDDESNNLHFAHFAWNVLAVLELMLRKEDA